MRKILIHMSALMAILLAIGCEATQMDDYVNDPGIYFHPDAKQDSLAYSFFFKKESVIRDTVYVRVNVTGMLTDYDRPIKLVQTNVGKSNAAVAGVHFIAFDDAEVKTFMRIPAHAAYVEVPVILLRDESLKSGEKRLGLAVAENEHFRLGINRWRSYVVKMTDTVSKPRIWDNEWSVIFGPTWGVEKMRLIIQSTGHTDWETVPREMAYNNWMGKVARQALADYNATHVKPYSEINPDVPVEF